MFVNVCGMVVLILSAVKVFVCVLFCEYCVSLYVRCVCVCVKCRKAHMI